MKNPTRILLRNRLITTRLDAQLTPATPAAELKKLDFLAGDWTDEGTTTVGPSGTPTSKWTMTTPPNGWKVTSFW
jgi:hypothetical protein